VYRKRGLYGVVLLVVGHQDFLFRLTTFDGLLADWFFFPLFSLASTVVGGVKYNAVESSKEVRKQCENFEERATSICKL